jgi:hypothetical protein
MTTATRASPEWTVRKARDIYLAENGFTIEEYTAEYFSLPVSRWDLKLRNYRWRQVGVPIHDLHHIVTGYGTGPIGEIEISAWETGAGLDGVIAAWALSFPVFLGGLIRHPRRAFRAYRQGHRSRSLFIEKLVYEDVLEMTVGELRSRLGVDQTGAADRPAGLNLRALGTMDSLPPS